MLSSTKMSMGFWLCKCADCRKKRLHHAHRWREREYKRIYKKLRKPLWKTQKIEDYEDIDFTTGKYTD